jgi:hypothetical protein
MDLEIFQVSAFLFVRFFARFVFLRDKRVTSTHNSQLGPLKVRGHICHKPYFLDLDADAGDILVAIGGKKIICG